MKVIVLAAGRGSRLGHLTDERPKSLLEFAGKPLLVRQMDCLRAAGLEDITVITGYLSAQIEALGVHTLHNPDWNETNMVATLMCAATLMDGSDDVLIAYADIQYERKVLAAISACDAPLSTVVDQGWSELWRARGADPLKEAETLKLDAEGCVTELGKKPVSLAEIQGQYIGLTKVSSAFCAEFVARYQGLDPLASYDGKTFRNMYMTSYLQHLVDAGVPLRAAFIDHGWIEVDTSDDLHAYSEMFRSGTLQALYDPSR